MKGELTPVKVLPFFLERGVIYDPESSTVESLNIDTRILPNTGVCKSSRRMNTG